MPSVKPSGGCACGKIRYQLNREPMLTHCCHCKWCQRETGSAFVINTLIEASEVELLGELPELVLTPSESGRGQLVGRCPSCRVALWSHYSAGEVISFIRVGTLDDPNLYPPDVHIFTNSKQAWVDLPETATSFPEFYNSREFWSPEVMSRWRAAVAVSKTPDTEKPAHR